MRAPLGTRVNRHARASFQISDEGSADAALVNEHSFGSQPPRLLAVRRRRRRKDDAPARADHSMPRQPHLFRRLSQRTSHQPRAAGQSGCPCDRTVGRYLPARDRGHRIPDLLEQGIVLRVARPAVRGSLREALCKIRTLLETLTRPTARVLFKPGPRRISVEYA